MEDIQDISHLFIFRDDTNLRILLNLLRPLDLDLPELDHLELVLLVLRLIDERSQVGLADFTIRVLLVDLVLILGMCEFAL